MADVMRLDNDTLAQPPPGLAMPRYQRRAMLERGGVVHLGVGAFHRAHQALYFDDLLNAGCSGFAVTGVSLQKYDVPQQLNPQGGLYSLLSLSNDAPMVRLVGCMDRVLHAPSQAPEVLACMADSRTWMYTLTITEKGYCHHPSSGELNVEHPDIAHDLEYPQQPKSALGFLCAALDRRRLAGELAPIVLCCDNLPSNGRVLRGLALSLSARNPALHDWIASNVSFPNTMVDRIVPATTVADQEFVRERFGYADAGLVKAEPFSQWVIEAGDMRLAPLAEVGATLVADVAPFELMKLRLLNGSHSLLAYLGYLAGHETVSDAMAAPGFGALIERFMDDEVAPTLLPPNDFDLGNYAAELRARFRNRALAHRTWQIAMDGSQKIPQRWLGTLRARIETGQSCARLALGLAAWMQYVTGFDLEGARIDVRDPLAERFAAIAMANPESASYAAAMLAVREVFAEDLVTPRLVAAIGAALERLRVSGVAACLQGLQ